ncbi:MAG: trehalase family glycosidase [Parvularculaceae bacterium]
MAMSDNLRKKAIEILTANDRGGYTVPTAGLYPYQWNWDSAFVALGFAIFDRDRAWREIETLFDAQWDDGFVPHIVFHVDDSGYFPGPSIWRTRNTPATSGITQPPVAASIVRSLWESGDRIERDRLAAIYPKLLAWHRWFHRYRDPLGNGLILATHPWESGRDNSPEWDAPTARIDTSGVEPYQRRDLTLVDHAMRPTKDDYDRYLAILQFGRGHNWDHKLIAENNPFRVIDVGMTMILLRANRDLLHMAEALGRTEDCKELSERIELSEDNVSYLWNEEIGAYCSRDIITDRSSGIVTNASFLSFYAGVGDASQKTTLIENLDRINACVRYLLPSTDPAHEKFNSILYWRGPVWAVVNQLVASGLAEQGYQTHAQKIVDDTRALIRSSGFFEAFCPVTGAGVGGAEFSWTAAIWLLLSADDGNQITLIKGAA